MKVICINRNGWHEFEGNAYAFLAPRVELIGYPEYGKEYVVTACSVDRLGDMLYNIEGYGDVGLEAEAFTTDVKTLSAKENHAHHPQLR